MSNSKQVFDVPQSICFHPDSGTVETVVSLFYFTQAEKSAPIFFMLARQAVEVLKCGDEADHLLGEQLQQSLDLFTEAFERMI